MRRLRPGVDAMERELAQLLGGMAEIAVAGADEPEDALEAEQWASGLVGTWRLGPLAGPDTDRLFGPGFVRAVERIGGAGAVIVLRALAAIGEEVYAAPARSAADRLVRSGVSGPPWLQSVGLARPVAALLMDEEDGFDDGLSVMIEFAAPAVDPHTVGIYIDHNMGGLVKDVFVAGPLEQVREQFECRGPAQRDLLLRELDLAQARMRVEQALEILDHTLDPPVSEDVLPLRAFMYARMRALPEQGAAPAEEPEVTPEERVRLFEDFLGSPEGGRWRGDEEAEDVVRLAIDFGADHNHGGPLRWSPVVVEIFMTSWLARKVSREPRFFERVPEVLREWVKFAGQRRGVRPAALREAVASVRRHSQEMLQTVNDPDAWGPAKTFAMAAHQAGVDLTDPDALSEFIARHNEELAA